MNPHILLLKMISKTHNEKSFTQVEAIELLVSLIAIDANSEKEWRGFYNFLLQIEFQVKWDEDWKDQLNQIKYLGGLMKN